MLREGPEVNVLGVLRGMAEVGGAVLAWGAILRVFFMPVIQGFVIRIIKTCIGDVHGDLIRYMREHPAEIDSVRVAWLERSRPAMAAYVREVLAPDFARADAREQRIQRVEQMTEINADRLEMLEAAIKAQGASLAEIPRMSEVVRNLNATMDRVSQNLEQIHKDVRGQSTELGRVTGFLEAGGWDGNERRKRSRNEGET